MRTRYDSDFTPFVVVGILAFVMLVVVAYHIATRPTRTQEIQRHGYTCMSMFANVPQDVQGSAVAACMKELGD